MNTLTKLFSPFKKLTDNEKKIAVLIIITLFTLLWSSSGSVYIPSPMEVIHSFPRLFEKDLVDNFIKSLLFCFKAMLYAFGIALIFCYISVLPIFRSFAEFLRKLRFLPSTGLSFLFMKITNNVEEQMLWMMIWGIVTWLIYSLVDIALSVSDDEVMYARSLRLNRWQVMRETLIKGKAADIFEAFIGNFAIAWMLLASIENIAKAQGGIGVVLAESNKYYKFDEVYAIQLLILILGIGIDSFLRWTKTIIFPYTKP